MQLIIPLAGKGTRLRPHTHTRPKPLIHLAGKPILGHILDSFKDLDISSAVFITGDMEEQIKKYISKNYSFDAHYVKQEALLGDGHAINLAKEYITEDVLIVFVDTIFKTNLNVIKDTKANGIVWVKEVDDPKRFGIVTLDENKQITKIIEKPENPPTNLALIGLYYLKDKNKLFRALNEIIEKKITSKKEYRLADALSLMLENGDKIISETVDLWADCGKPETLLSTNRALLKEKQHNIKTENSVIIEPVYIEEYVKITDSIIGPNVSIAKGSKIERSIIKESIINTNSKIKDTVIEDSLIGSDTSVVFSSMKINIGDHSRLNS